MNRLPKACCLIAGLAITAAAPAAIAAQNGAKATKQPMSIAQKNALGKSMAQKNRNFKQPTTMAQSNATKVRHADGTVSMKAPTELWNHLGAQYDAKGNVQLTESSNGIAPATKTEGLDNE